MFNVSLSASIKKKIMLQHIDKKHFDYCPIRLSTFMRSFEKRTHMLNNHEVNHVTSEEDAGNEDESDTIEELDFRQNIVRHSTLTRTVEMKFVGDDLNVMTDLKMTNKRTNGSK